MLPIMVPGDLDGLTRQQLVDLAITQHQRLADQGLHLAAQEAELTLQRERLAALEGEKADLAAKLARATKALFGPSSERSKRPEEPSGLFGTPQGDAEAQNSQPREKQKISYERDRPAPKGHGRRPVSLKLIEKEHIVPVPPEQRIGPNGEQLVLLGYEVSEKLDVVEEHLRRLIIKREKWGLPDTRETVITAAVEPCLIPKGKASDAFIHELIVNKFHLGLPLYRQLVDLNHRGAEVNSAWLSDLVRQTAGRYASIHQAIRLQVLAHPFVHADETPVRQQTGEEARTGYFWAWLAGRQLYLHYGHGRSQAEALEVTGVDPEGGWPPGSTLGFVVCDGYDGYNPLFADGTVQRVACWSHVRRKFTDYEETDRNAAAMAERINDLFRVERQATKDIQKGRLDDTAAAALRLARRQESGRPIVADIKARLERLQPLYTPKSGMRTAINYALTLWTALEIFLADGRLPADNNAAVASRSALEWRTSMN